MGEPESLIEGYPKGVDDPICCLIQPHRRADAAAGRTARRGVNARLPAEQILVQRSEVRGQPLATRGYVSCELSGRALAARLLRRRG